MTRQELRDDIRSALTIYRNLPDDEIFEGLVNVLLASADIWAAQQSIEAIGEILQ